MMANILLLNDREAFSVAVIDKWRQLAQNQAHSFIVLQERTIDLAQVLADFPQTEILICTYGDYSASNLAKLPNLKAIVATTTAVEYIDQMCCSEKNIRLFNTSNYTGTAVAEHLLALLMSVARRIVYSSTPDSKLSDVEKLGFEVAGKTIGILGFGHIGQAFAKIAHGIGMVVFHYNRTPKHSDISTQLPLDDLISQSDVLAVTLPLNSETRCLLDAEKLRQLKTEALLISISPDGVIDLDSLETKLKSGEIGGVGLDLHHPRENLYKYKNFVGTHTQGWFTKECVERRTQAFLAQLDRYLKTT